MYYFVNVDHNSMAAHFTISDCEGCYELLYIQFIGWNYGLWLWNGSKEDGNVSSSLKMKALTLKMERVTLIDKG
jgi:hypothetical protein